MDDKKKHYIIISTIIILILLIIGVLIWLLTRKEVFKKEIGLEENVIYMKVDEIKLLPYVTDSDDDIIFESSNSLVAKIDNQGYIYALKVGRVKISVYYMNNPESIKTCEVYVSEGAGSPQKDSDEKTTGDGDTKKPISEEPIETKPKATCKLKVSSDGMINSVNKNAIKYGFDKNNIDMNEISRHINDIPNKEETSMEGWTYYRIRYYVENEDGIKGNCSIVVVKKCSNNECIYEAN